MRAKRSGSAGWTRISRRRGGDTIAKRRRGRHGWVSRWRWPRGSCSSPMGERTCQRWLIGGRVQGVGYRAWMVERARALTVDGWVRNLTSGGVEAAVLGEAEAVMRLHHACRRGPRSARVEKIDTLPLEPDLIVSVGFHQVEDGP